MVPGDWLSLILAVGFPVLAVHAADRGWLPAWCSSIVACYGIGIIVSNLRLWPVDSSLMETVAGGGMLVGLPLLLFSVRIAESLRHARRMLLSFALCCVSGLFFTSVACLLFSDALADSWKVAGMLTGLYTGGTPNVQAIGLALRAPAEYLVLIQAADVLLGGAYLLGLVTVLPALYGRFYPILPANVSGGDAGAAEHRRSNGFWHTTRQLFAGLTVLGAGLLLCRLISGVWLDPTIIILAITTLSLVVAASPARRFIGNSYPLGEYFVLIFCVALGLMADFRALAAHGRELLYFSAIALVGTTVLHLILCRLFRLDRDTVILSYVAALYGPVFVVQVAAALRNRELLAAGIGVSLVGFGIGNYLGIGVAYLLFYLTA
ncbi:DUF819 family protein [Lewinella sp. JB7]|uniref:DUF819 family protein n=1 Tax=Lewinella sp. JB7 TaxID=2962887 RepID=UPI0020C9E5A0|nr:DUF819 family protein [Lewinella sp. JB7]MCP9235419.1 DUF819 family protein [Lewinella sp. JB7]